MYVYDDDDDGGMRHCVKYTAVVRYRIQVGRVVVLWIDSSDGDEPRITKSILTRPIDRMEFVARMKENRLQCRAD
jgi:hypothetical protein